MLQSLLAERFQLVADHDTREMPVYAHAKRLQRDVSRVQKSDFESSLPHGRSTSTSETATKFIVDLSTMEQMLTGVITDGKANPESFKHFHIEHFAKYSRELIELLDSLFGSTWVEKSPTNQDPFRRLYVHGWPFDLKAIASA
jgi:uncharacterized protein (TIGR03435 family)